MLYPNDFVKKLWAKIPAYIKTTFFATMAIGLLVHIYFFTNFFPNHDAFALFDDYYLSSTQGRWFAIVPGTMAGTFPTPWVNGFFGILYVAVAACFVAATLKINAPLHCVLLGGLMVTFPTVTGTIVYVTYIDILLFAVLPASMAVYFTLRYKFGCIAGVFLVMFSLGCYQSYIAVTACLAVGVLLLDILQNEAPVKRVVWKGVKLLAMLVAGILLYLVVVKVIFSFVPATSYQGISSMGSISFSQLPGMFKKVFSGIAGYYMLGARQFHYGFLGVLFPVVCVAAVVLAAILVYKRKVYKNPGKLVLLGVLVVLYLVAANLVQLMGAQVVYINMMYGLVMLPVLVLALMDRVYSAKLDFKKAVAVAGKCACWFLCLVMSLYIFNYSILANKAYAKLNIAYEQGYAYMVELITRIESTEGYTQGVHVVFVGTPGLSIEQHEPFGEVNGIYGATGNLVSTYSYPQFMRNILGFGGQMVPLPEETLEEIYSNEEFLAMPCYPAAGAVQRIDDMVVVKFEEPPFV